MKKVIIEQKSDNVYLSDLSKKDIIGIIWKSGAKGFIQRSEDRGFYAISDIKESHIFEHKVFYNSIFEYCSQKQIENVFVFDNEKELFKWMSE